MAHLAAMSLHVHRDVLADSKSAPNGAEDLEVSEAMMVDDLSNFFDAFIINKGSKATNSVDVSTDSGSEQLNTSEDFVPLIQDRARLSVFQTVCGQITVDGKSAGEKTQISLE